MNIHVMSIVLGATLLGIGSASAQQGEYPMMEKIAAKVVEHYQTTSCEALAQEKAQPKSGQKAQMEQKAIEQLRSDANMRKQFLNKVAGPIANKLFECGMIP